MTQTLPAALSALTTRVDALHLYDDEIDGLVRLLPPLPLSYSPSNTGLVALNLALHNVGTLRAANEAVEAFKTLWDAGLLTSIVLPARLLFELLGAACYSENLVEAISDSNQSSAVFDRSVELFLGSRHPVPQFDGRFAEIKSIHVMDLVRAIMRHRADATEVYGFLSEACHPSYLQHSYLWMAGPTGDNWGNEKFAGYASKLLDRLVRCVEDTAVRIVDVSRTVQRHCRSHIEPDFAGPPTPT